MKMKGFTLERQRPRFATERLTFIKQFNLPKFLFSHLQVKNKIFNLHIAYITVFHFPSTRD